MSQGTSNFQGIIGTLIAIVSGATFVIATLALLVFLWGLARFVLNSGDEKGREEGKKIMFWGIIALFVMVSVFGIVSVLQTTFFGSGFIDTPIPGGYTPPNFG